MNTVDRLDLHYEPSIDQKIDSMITNQIAFVPNGCRFFAFEWYATSLQFESDGGRID